MTFWYTYISCVDNHFYVMLFVKHLITMCCQIMKAVFNNNSLLQILFHLDMLEIWIDELQTLWCWTFWKLASVTFKIKFSPAICFLVTWFVWKNSMLFLFNNSNSGCGRYSLYFFTVSFCMQVNNNLSNILGYIYHQTLIHNFLNWNRPLKKVIFMLI